MTNRAHRRLPREAAWYLLAGMGATATQALLFLLLREPLGAIKGNLVALTITTVANTEFHRTVTFRASPGSLSRRVVAVGLTVVFYASYSSAALLALQLVVDDPTAFQQTAAIIGAASLGGIARFTMLRTWVFHRPAVDALRPTASR